MFLISTQNLNNIFYMFGFKKNIKKGKYEENYFLLFYLKQEEKSITIKGDQEEYSLKLLNFPIK